MSFRDYLYCHADGLFITFTAGFVNSHWWMNKGVHGLSPIVLLTSCSMSLVVFKINSALLLHREVCKSKLETDYLRQRVLYNKLQT